MINITITKKHLYALSVLLLSLAVIVPVGVWAADQFTDVPDANVFHGDIAWLADAGITKGCNPPTNTEFCPKDEVTREQMAAFMNRFAGFLGAQDGVVSQADKAATATNADTLDGIDSSGFVTDAELAAKTVVEPVAGGFVGSTGTLVSSFLQIGDDWTVTKGGAVGTYLIGLPGTNRLCTPSNLPLVSATAFDSGEANVSTVTLFCDDRITQVVVKTYDSAGNPADKSFHFLMYRGAGGQQPLSTIDAEQCVYDGNGLVCDGQPIEP